MRLITTLTGLALSTSIFLLWPSKPETLNDGIDETPYANTNPKGTTKPSVSSGTSATALAFNWRIGDESVYQAEWSVGPVQQGLANSSLFSYEIQRKVLEVTEQSVLIAAAVTNFELNDGSNTDYSSLKDELEQQVSYIQYSLNGAIEELLVSKSLAIPDAMTLRQLNGLEVQLPTAPLSIGDTWSAEEVNDNGSLNTQYTYSGPLFIEKAITKINVADPMQGGFKLEVGDNYYSIELGESWINSYSGSDVVQVVNNNEIVSQLQNSLYVQLIPGEKAYLLNGITLDSYHRDRSLLASTLDELNPTKVSKWTKIREKEKLKVYEDITVDAITERFYSGISKASNHQQTVEFIEDLANWIKFDPSRAKEIEKILTSVGLESVVTSRMMHALEQASESHEVQQVLANLYSNDSLPDIIREQALVALSGIKGNVSPALIELLVNDASQHQYEQSAGPILNLGALAANNNYAAQELEQNFGKLLTPELKTDANQLTAVIDAYTNGELTNSAFSSYIEQHHIDHESTSVRLAAINYLSEVKQAEAGTFIALLNDADTNVQSASVSALFKASSQAGAQHGLELALQPSTDDAVRLEVLSQLGQNETLSQTYAHQIREVSSVTESEEIKQIIDSILTKNG